jgi:CDP-diacylglycerol--glycerol-3-phosphate 3-phosphatidyltransferase
MTDIADGFVARRMNQETELGAKLDPLVDKIMIHSIVFSLFYMGIYNPLLVFAMFFRDMIVDGMRNMISEFSYPFGSNLWGKAKFSFQSASVGCGLMFCMDSSLKEVAWLANALLGAALAVSLPGIVNVWFGLFSKSDTHVTTASRRL